MDTDEIIIAVVVPSVLIILIIFHYKEHIKHVFSWSKNQVKNKSPKNKSPPKRATPKTKMRTGGVRS